MSKRTLAERVGCDGVGDDDSVPGLTTIIRSFDYIKDHGGRISRTTAATTTESFVATFIARETNPRIHIRLIVGVSSRSRERILSTRIIRLLDVCHPTLSLSFCRSLTLSLALATTLIRPSIFAVVRLTS